MIYEDTADTFSSALPEPTVSVKTHTLQEQSIIFIFLGHFNHLPYLASGHYPHRNIKDAGNKKVYASNCKEGSEIFF